MSEQTKVIRELNDQFRKGNSDVPGQILVTSGVQELVNQHTDKELSDVFEGVKAFDSFTPDNDPHGEHDFGSLDMLGEKLFWKIDYYAPDMLHGSQDPSDIAKTVRVLTIMLASEY